MIETTQVEQLKLSKLMGSEYMDEYIPLPDVDLQDIPDLIKNCDVDHDELENAVYWENEKGSHGWCCPECGTVTQWG